MEKTTFEPRQTCADCRFSDKHIQENHNIVTICRFNPPVIAHAFLPTPQGQAQILSQSLWPILTNVDWCSKLETRAN